VADIERLRAAARGWLEADVRRTWEDESMEAHAAIHGVEIG
jgi:hypothetical protein